MNFKKTVGKSTVIWLLSGFLLGGLVGGTTALIIWTAIPSKGAELPFPLTSATDVTIAAGVLGACAGFIVALVGGSVASAAHASVEEMADAVIDGSFATGASMGIGITASAFFDLTWAPIAAVMVGPGAIVLKKVWIVAVRAGARRTLPIMTLYFRGVIGAVLGIISGMLTEGLIIGVLILSLPSEIAISLIVGFGGAVGPIVGTCAGGAAAIGISCTGGSCRRAAYFAIEASAIATVATSAGIVLSDSGLTIVGIVVATITATVWSVTRGRLIRVPDLFEQRPRQKGRTRRQRTR